MLNEAQSDGESLRTHLLSVYRQTGKLPEQLAIEPDMPQSVAHVWQYFTELHRTRGGNGFGANPIAYMEIESWCRLSGISLYPWEVALITALDNAYLSEQAKQSAKKKD